ncbi:subtilase cytotoxin subunit B [Salmonella enterica]|nr:subtilase cytotoxin subunit B [Salmonella enterica]EEI9212327.1 subtilase cytotoxin subunit B [Salmonella enterica subsp. enterica serovar Carrau]EEJ7412437.1 subtilase cytotoxin subunit B [Salmonella enterica subsp. enterica serovar Sandiego]HCM4644568.1 subtilase cytotoxin subunit B [Salmonella enterica subsp. enterica serovar Panama]EDI6983373.1 subtilase cytotoxin subunit B [Salmonella enterica]
MKKITSVCVLLSLICSFNASAEWTGDNISGYYKNRIISEFHVGQVGNGDYFCIKLVRANANSGDTPDTMCSVSNQSIWAPSFKILKEQARYFYATGQTIMVYFMYTTWTYKPFLDTFSNRVLTGFSTCNNATDCFGPTPK